jgi:hypothetical protein
MIYLNAYYTIWTHNEQSFLKKHILYLCGWCGCIHEYNNIYIKYRASSIMLNIF